MATVWIEVGTVMLAGLAGYIAVFGAYFYLLGELRLNKVLKIVASSLVSVLLFLSAFVDLGFIVLVLGQRWYYRRVNKAQALLRRLTLIVVIILFDAIGDVTTFTFFLIGKIANLSQLEVAIIGVPAQSLAFLVIIWQLKKRQLFKTLAVHTDTAFKLALRLFIFYIFVHSIEVVLITLTDEWMLVIVSAIIAIFTIALLVIVFYFYQDTVTKLENTALVAEQARQMKAFQLYLQEINDYYQEIANFRHDYKNLLLTLGNRIAKSGDADLQSYYQQMVTYSDQQIRGVIKSRNLAQLEQIELQSLRSVILAKLTKANQLGIETQLNVTGWVQGGRVNELELARIVAILLDNAIEASSKQEQKWLGIGLDSYGEDGVDILIENKFTGDKAPNLTAWFERGYTTKGSNHGRGLAIVNQLCDKNLIDLEVEYKRGLVCFILGIGV